MREEIFNTAKFDRETWYAYQNDNVEYFDTGVSISFGSMGTFKVYFNFDVTYAKEVGKFYFADSDNDVIFTRTLENGHLWYEKCKDCTCGFELYQQIYEHAIDELKEFKIQGI